MMSWCPQGRIGRGRHATIVEKMGMLRKPIGRKLQLRREIQVVEGDFLAIHWASWFTKNFTFKVGTSYALNSHTSKNN